LELKILKNKTDLMPITIFRWLFVLCKIKKTFMQKRYDLEIIAKLINSKAKVLDIGCGEGELLEILQNEKEVDARGIEINEKSVSKAVSKGISVIQGNADKDLKHYPDNSFDYAILSQTIQAMFEPKEIIKQMLRIADNAIISLPNFAYYKNRFYLLFKGEMPVRKTIPHSWYNTPNIHFCSIDDFINLCQEMGFTIKHKTFLSQNFQIMKGIKSGFLANFFAEFGVFVISKDKPALNTQCEFVFKKTNSNILRKNTIGLAKN
jgi:methionine biosynthesis protein MetW